MLLDLGRVNPHQQAMVMDPSPHIAARCPRRAGKSYAGSAAALIVGEAQPGSISLIISLNLKQLKRLYWAGGPSGLFSLSRKYGLDLQFNKNECRWEHENGSIGYLLGTDSDEQLEVIRGMEADLYLIDECKSFSPGALSVLIDEIIDPQASSRNGRVIMIGTPGFIPSGPFYRATCDKALDKQGRNYFIRAGQKDPYGRTPEADDLWSLHEWTMEDNKAKPQQWKCAQIKKRAKGWSDDHPTWLREYLGQWTQSTEGLVYRYAHEKSSGSVTWKPDYSKETGDVATGLPKLGGPWRLVAGLDMGFEAPTAFVVAGYSTKLRELRVIHDVSRSHMLAPDLADMIQDAIDHFGPIEMIYADVGNLGKTLVETMKALDGFPLERADKREKFDHVELLNGAFTRGEVKIIEGTVLETQLLTNAWDLGDDDRDDDDREARTLKEHRARTSRLKEDKSIPNDSTDALLYLYRGSCHHFGEGVPEELPEYLSPEWIKRWEAEQLAKARSPRELLPGYLRRALERKPLPYRMHAAITRRLRVNAPRLYT